MRSSRGSVRTAVATMLVLVVAGVTASTTLQAHAAIPIPAFDHVFVVVEENHDYSEIIGNSQAPYINGLASQNGLAVQYSAVSHPSLPNYLALTGGSTFGVTTDCAPTACPINAPNLADRIEGTGKTWRAYMDAMPSACGTSSSGTYVVRHDPFVYYNDIRNNSARCSSHVVPYPNLATDLASASTTPNYAWITPDVCNDMHDCAISVGDTWLKNNLPAIFSSPAWTTKKSVLLLTWDEGSTNHVATLAIGPSVRPGYQSSAAYTHYSLLRTVESAWNLAPLTTNDTNAIPMSDFFSGAITGSVTSSAGGAISGATVTDSTSNTSATTDPQGNYTLANLAAGSHSLTASGATFTTSIAQLSTVNAGQTSTGVNFTLTPTPAIWSASYAVGNTPTTWTAGQAQSYAVTVTNTGNQLWPSGGSTPARLGVHFATTGGGINSTPLTDQRFNLPADLAPGASVTLTVNITAPTTTGSLVLEYQMVKERQFWFTQFSDVNVTVAASTAVWSAGYAVGNTPTAWNPGQTQSYAVIVTNTGNQLWPSGGSTPARLGVHFATTGGGINSTPLTDQRFNLPADLAPGASVTLTVNITAPTTTGSLVLEYQMVKETQFWFTQISDVNVTVVASTAVWSAGYAVGNTPTAWTPGQVRSYAVNITNTGNQTWPAGGSTLVRLGVHFAATGGGINSTPLTDQRFNLPADLAPGASVTLTVNVTTPTTTGRLVLEYQMVKETQFWFTQFSDVNVTVA